MTDYYADGRLLQAKNELVGFDVAAWVLGLVDLDPVRRALDAGCGWGRFAGPLLARAPHVALVCTDLRPGMAASCRQNVPAAHVAATDVERLPFASGAFDLVLANHMLYLFDDPSIAIAELARAVAPSGSLVATTYADREVPLMTFHRRALGRTEPPGARSSFSLANGAELLRTAFDAVVVHTIDVIEPVDPDALTAVYEQTGAYAAVGTTQQLDAFRREAARAVADDPDLATTTTWVLFVARQPTL